MSTEPTDPKTVNVDVTLRYTTETGLGLNSDSAGDCFVHLNAEIIGIDWPESGGVSREVKMGELQLCLIRVGKAIERGVPLYSVFDFDQATANLAGALFDDSFDDYGKAVMKLFDDANSWDDLLVLDRLEIYPFARGQKLGLAVLSNAIDDWSSGCSLVVMKPYPLQFEYEAEKRGYWQTLALSEFSQDKKKAFKRLQTYYSQLGFKRIGRTDYSALCTHHKRVSAKKLGLADSYVVPESAFAQTSNTVSIFSDQ